MKLRENFPKTKEEAHKFGVERRDPLGVFKIFEGKNTVEETVNEVNTFLIKNGYKAIPIVEFIENEYSYDSDDKLVSLGLHGYKEALVLFIENEDIIMLKQYTNVDKDVLSLLKDFFRQLKDKTTGFEPARNIPKILEDLEEFPTIPKHNIFVSFEYQNNSYYVTYTDYKIELTNYVETFYEDEQGNRSDFEQFKQDCFMYEIDGYIDVNGNIDEFRVLILNALKNVSVQEIAISDEDF